MWLTSPWAQALLTPVLHSIHHLSLKRMKHRLMSILEVGLTCMHLHRGSKPDHN